jgi:hypothetical protein
MSTITADQPLLPHGFKDLEPFVERWVLDDTGARIRARSESSMTQIQAFYDAMTERAVEAIRLIEGYPLNDMPPAIERLAKLTLALAQAATAVEIHQQPIAPGSPYPNSIKLVRGTQPFG